MDKLIDQHGFPYFDRLPEDYTLATIDDFHANGNLTLGMEYLIRWTDREYYECRVVNEKLTGKYIKPFIDDQRVFILHELKET